MSPKSSRLFPITCPTLIVSVSIAVPHFLAVTPSRTLQSSLLLFTFPTRLHPMAVIPLPSKLTYSPSRAMYLLLFSSGTFKLTYAPWHTSQFLSQAKSTTIDGFLDGQLGPDPKYGTCLQCAAIDRARLKTNPVTPRSGICSSCFKKYCYDPQNPPPEGQIVGRRFKFKDPDPYGVKTLYIEHKTAVTIAAVIITLGLIATITGCVMFWLRRFRRRKIRSVGYRRLSRDNGSEWSPHMGWEGNDMAPPDYSSLDHKRARSYYSEASYEIAKPDYAEPSYEMEKVHHAEPSYETAKTHNAERSYEAHHAEPGHETANTESSYSSEQRN